MMTHDSFKKQNDGECKCFDSSASLCGCDTKTVREIDAYLKTWQVFRRVDELFTLATSSGGVDSNTSNIIAKKSVDLLYQNYLTEDFHYTLVDDTSSRYVKGREEVVELLNRFIKRYIFRYTFPPVSNLYTVREESGRRIVELDSDVNHFHVLNANENIPDSTEVIGDGFLQFGKHRLVAEEVSPGVFKMKSAQLQNYKLIKIAKANVLAESPLLIGEVPLPIVPPI